MNAVPLTNKKKQSILESNHHSIEEKLGGNRAFLLLSIDGNKMVTRGGKDISHLIPHIINTPWHMKDCILDGENYDMQMTDAQIAGHLNYRSTDIAPATIRFHAFDCVMSNGIDNTDTALIHRRVDLNLAMSLIRNPNIVILPNYPLHKTPAGDAIQYYDFIVDSGGEGVMIKHDYAKYFPGKRPVNVWWKIKKISTYDAVIIGFTEAKHGKTGKFDGLIGAIEYGAYINNELRFIGKCSGMDDDTRKAMSTTPIDYMGRVFEMEAQEKLASGNLKDPRFIRLRDDKTKEECIW